MEVPRAGNLSIVQVVTKMVDKLTWRLLKISRFYRYSFTWAFEVDRRDGMFLWSALGRVSSPERFVLPHTGNSPPTRTHVSIITPGSERHHYHRMRTINGDTDISHVSFHVHFSSTAIASFGRQISKYSPGIIVVPPTVPTYLEANDTMRLNHFMRGGY